MNYHHHHMRGYGPPQQMPYFYEPNRPVGYPLADSYVHHSYDHHPNFPNPPYNPSAGWNYDFHNHHHHHQTSLTTHNSVHPSPHVPETPPPPYFPENPIQYQPPLPSPRKPPLLKTPKISLAYANTCDSKALEDLRKENEQLKLSLDHAVKQNKMFQKLVESLLKGSTAAASEIPLLVCPKSQSGEQSSSREETMSPRSWISELSVHEQIAQIVVFEEEEEESDTEMTEEEVMTELQKARDRWRKLQENMQDQTTEDNCETPESAEQDGTSATQLSLSDSLNLSANLAANPTSPSPGQREFGINSESGLEGKPIPKVMNAERSLKGQRLCQKPLPSTVNPLPVNSPQPPPAKKVRTKGITDERPNLIPLMSIRVAPPSPPLRPKEESH